MNEALLTIDAERLIHGCLVKCIDGRWSSSDGESLTGMQMLVLHTVRAVQRWENKESGRDDYRDARRAAT
jgi:hypothetical protein